MWLDRRYLANKQAERLLLWFVWRLPRKLVMWCYIRVAAHAMTGYHSGTRVGDLRMMDALKRWERR
jgi:hypothetical protein